MKKNCSRILIVLAFIILVTVLSVIPIVYVFAANATAGNQTTPTFKNQNSTTSQTSSTSIFQNYQTTPTNMNQNSTTSQTSSTPIFQNYQTNQTTTASTNQNTTTRDSLPQQHDTWYWYMMDKNSTAEKTNTDTQIKDSQAQAGQQNTTQQQAPQASGQQPPQQR